MPGTGVEPALECGWSAEQNGTLQVTEIPMEIGGGGGNRTRVRLVQLALKTRTQAQRQPIGSDADPSFRFGFAEQSEPSRLATEINARRDAYGAPNPPSPVPVHQTPTAKTPRNRVFFSVHPWMYAESLCNRRLGGGGGSRGRTRLRGLLPVKQGKYREFLRFQPSLGKSGPSFPSISEVVTTNSL